MSEKDDSVFIRHIIDSIQAIEEFSRNLSKEELTSNRLKQSAIVREIEIIGEASKNISNSLKEKYKKIEWKKIAGTRDRIIHRYFNVNLDIVWDIINKDLLELKKQLEEIRKELKP